MPQVQRHKIEMDEVGKSVISYGKDSYGIFLAASLLLGSYNISVNENSFLL